MEQSASSLTVNTTYSSGVADPDKLVFSIDRISSVDIIADDFGEKGVFLTPDWDSWQPSSEVEDMMIKIRRKYNHISSQRGQQP